MNGMDLVNNLVDELERAAALLTELKDNFMPEYEDEINELFDDINADMDRFTDYTDSIDALLSDLEIDAEEAEQETTYCYRVEYIYRLEANTIPSLESADALAREWEGVAGEWLDKAMDAGYLRMTGYDITVKPKTYDNEKDGVVDYKVVCDFSCKNDLADSFDAIQTDIGGRIANAVQSKGHNVLYFGVNKASEAVKASQTNDFER